MRIVIVGHVDHGKSTLVGRLLHETDSLDEGKLEAIQSSCERRNVPFQWAFLTDALQAERDQNVTIDAAQVWFDWGDRPYTLIDAPGHREFLKNMVSGAARADAALLVIAADEGIQEQSRRHCHLLSMLGLDQVCVVVNKMDAVGYEEQRFEQIVEEYSEFLGEIGIPAAFFLPTSAVHGVNLVSRSSEIWWWQGPTLVEALDTFTLPSAPESGPLRFTVQDVYRFDERRILAGRVESGTLAVGDEVVFSPHRRAARVRSIERWQSASRESARTGESIGITLERQIFVERGDVASRIDSTPSVSRRFRANVFWFGESPLSVDRRYTLKLATQSEKCSFEIVRVVDGSALTLVEDADSVARYQVAEVIIETARPLVLEQHTSLPELGRFVIVDGFAILGGGTVLEADLQSENIYWERGKVAPEDRERLNGHRGLCVWLTGLSGAGKSSVAVELEAQLHAEGIHTFILDGDNVRHGLGSDLGFSPADRDEHLRRVGEVSKLFVNAGLVVICAFISPYQHVRERVRQSLSDGQFVEVFVSAPLEACERRDPKGLYRRARSGEIKNFTGIDAPYEEPLSPDVVVDTVDDPDAGVSARTIIGYLRDEGLLARHQSPGAIRGLKND